MAFARRGQRHPICYEAGSPARPNARDGVVVASDVDVALTVPAIAVVNALIASRMALVLEETPPRDRPLDCE